MVHKVSGIECSLIIKIYNAIPSIDKINSFLTITGKLLVMIGNLLYVFSSCKRHSTPTKEMHIPLRLISEGDTLCCQLYKKWQLSEIGRPNCLT